MDIEEIIARALDRNGVLDLPEDTVGLYPSWPKDAQADLRGQASRIVDALNKAGYFIRRRPQFQ